MKVTRVLCLRGSVVHPDGPKRLYSLRPEPFQELEAWLRTYKENMQQSFSRLDAHLERMKKKEVK